MADTVDDSSSVPLKKRNTEITADGDKPKYTTLSSFDGFSIGKIINENPKTKTVTVLGKFAGSDTDAVVLLEKKAFDTSKLSKCLSLETSVEETLKNDIYGTYDAFPSTSENAVKAFVIHPATEKHIAKYSSQERHIIRETTELYTCVTLPHLEKYQFSTQWVNNILEKKQEADRIVFEDADKETGFILLPDMKWDRKDVKSLYLVAIVHQSGLRSLRDLKEAHLPLLKNVLHKGTEAIESQFGVKKNELQMFLHYQPSYYHLHVHFTHIKLEVAGFGADRAHLLDDVIQNIDMIPDYYQRKTLTYSVREQDELYTKFKDDGYFETK